MYPEPWRVMIRGRLPPRGAVGPARGVSYPARGTVNTPRPDGEGGAGVDGAGRIGAPIVPREPRCAEATPAGKHTSAAIDAVRVMRAMRIDWIIGTPCSSRGSGAPTSNIAPVHEGVQRAVAARVYSTHDTAHRGRTAPANDRPPRARTRDRRGQR